VTPQVVILSAPSGGGKTTITQRLLEARPRDLGYSVSATTRPPRPGERDGEAYHFLTRAEFERRRAAGEFLESAEYAGHLYGTLREEVERVLRSGRHVVMDIEIDGARQVQAQYPWPHSVSIFVLPPSVAVLRERLRERRSESPGDLGRRLSRAVAEVGAAGEFDFRVVNDRLDDAVREIGAIIDGRRARRGPTAADSALIQELQRGLT
jgi:guanylate kinase